MTLDPGNFWLSRSPSRSNSLSLSPFLCRSLSVFLSAFFFRSLYCWGPKVTAAIDGSPAAARRSGLLSSFSDLFPSFPPGFPQCFAPVFPCFSLSRSSPHMQVPRALQGQRPVCPIPVSPACRLACSQTRGSRRTPILLLLSLLPR